MLIKSVHVERFRSIRQETLVCDPLTVLVGPNGAGKSTFLHALRVFYDVSAKIGHEDFYSRNTERPIVIRVVYGDLRDDEREEFKPYLQGDTLTVTKRVSWNDVRVEQKYYAAALQVAAFSKIRAAKGKREQISLWNELVEAKALPGLTERAKAGQDVEVLMKGYEDAHAETLEPIEREEQFFGPKNIGGGKLDNYTKFVYLPAVRDVSEETVESKSGTLTQLLDTIVMRKLQSRPEVQALKTDFGQRLKDLYAPANIAELSELAKGISKTLNEFVPGTEFYLEFGQVKLPDIPTPPAIPTVTEDEFAGDITRKGHGLQRALIFTLLQHLAVLQRPGESEAEAPATGEAAPTAAGTEPTGPDLILAIEEPELYQHPQRCRYLAEVLLELSKDPGRGLGGRNQVIYSTHSPYFVSLDRFSQMRLARKVKPAPDEPLATVLAAFSLADAAKRLAEITGGEETEFTSDRFRARAYPIMTPIVSEGFFANAVCVVEGMTEAGALWKLSELLAQEWLRKGIVVIPAAGKTSIDKPVVIFRGFKIPVYFIFDGDSRHKGKQAGTNTAKANRHCLRLAGVAEGQVVDFPPSSVNEAWACFEDKFETYCEQELDATIFERGRAEAAKGFGYEEPAEAMKNFDVAASFIERIYAEGHRLPKLEGVVKRISALVGDGSPRSET